MNSHVSNRLASDERVLAVCIVAFMMFFVGYTASRATLSQSSTTDSVDAQFVIPHEAELWRYFGE